MSMVTSHVFLSLFETEFVKSDGPVTRYEDGNHTYLFTFFCGLCGQGIKQRFREETSWSSRASALAIDMDMHLDKEHEWRKVVIA